MRPNQDGVIPGRGCRFGVVGRASTWSVSWVRSEKSCVNSKPLESGAGEGESPVEVSVRLCWRVFPSNTELVEFCVNLAGPPAKPKYSLMTDSGPVP